MANSFSYRLLQKLGMDFSEGEYGNISFFFLIKRFFIRMRNSFLLKYCMHSVIFSPFNYRRIRPMLWRWMGVKVASRVFIGYEVLLDTTYAHMIMIEEGVHIANRCILLCHQRDLKDYVVGMEYSKLPYRKGTIVLRKGCLIGMNSVIMPGVEIGEGAIVGTCSLVTKDVPAWTIVAGSPAKVIKKVPEEVN
jgi:acetyltransferase-like isoleucine patch superfamily enzyme